MKSGSNYRVPIAAVMAASAALAAFLVLYFSQGTQTDTEVAPLTGKNATVIIAKGIDAIDSGVTFNPPFIRVIAGHNDTVT